MIAALAFAISAGAGVAHAATDAKLVAEAQSTLATYKRTDPGMTAFIEHSAGYVVFPSVVKAGIGIGGAHGSGRRVRAWQTDRPGHPFAGVGGGTAGRSGLLGGDRFETPQALANFTSGQFSFSAQASAVALKSGAAANAKFKEGVAVFTAAKGGLMLEASLADRSSVRGLLGRSRPN